MVCRRTLGVREFSAPAASLYCCCTELVLRVETTGMPGSWCAKWEDCIHPLNTSQHTDRACLLRRLVLEIQIWWGPQKPACSVRYSMLMEVSAGINSRYQGVSHVV